MVDSQKGVAKLSRRWIYQKERDRRTVRLYASVFIYRAAEKA